MLYIALLFILAGAYYVSGLFTFSDVNLINYGDYLTYILLHPFHLWWNDKTPVVMGTACILWLMGVSYFLTYYRNCHFGAEHGTASWMESSFRRMWIRRIIQVSAKGNPDNAEDQRRKPPAIYGQGLFPVSDCFQELILITPVIDNAKDNDL